MKKIILLLVTIGAIMGCSKQPQRTINTKWDINVVPAEKETYEFKAVLEKTTILKSGNWHDVEIVQMNIPPLLLKPNVPADDQVSEPDISRVMKSKAILNATGETVTFELLVEDDGAIYSTNGVITIE